MEQTEVEALAQRTKQRMTALGIPQGTDNQALLFLGAEALPDREDEC